MFSVVQLSHSRFLPVPVKSTGPTKRLHWPWWIVKRTVQEKVSKRKSADVQSTFPWFNMNPSGAFRGFSPLFGSWNIEVWERTWRRVRDMNQTLLGLALEIKTQLQMSQSEICTLPRAIFGFGRVPHLQTLGWITKAFIQIKPPRN